MQGYLKLKDTDQELYEVHKDIKKEKQKGFISSIEYIFLKIFYSIVVKIKVIFHIITVKEIYSGLIFILPISKIEERQIKKYIKKVNKLMKKYQISSMVISENLRKNEVFMKHFYQSKNVEKQVHILDGKGLMPYIIKEVIEYILKKKNSSSKVELEDLYVLVNQENSNNNENLVYLAQCFKTINIVTPYIQQYQKFANQLEDKYSAMITVTNNKKKSLRKAKWIVNFNMPISEMKKYTIYRTATIIYLNQNEVYEANTFAGLHICKAGINVSEEISEFFKKEGLINQCPLTILYESTISGINKFKTVKDKIKNDKVKISKLYGSRGVLEEMEYKKVV